MIDRKSFLKDGRSFTNEWTRKEAEIHLDCRVRVATGDYGIIINAIEIDCPEAGPPFWVCISDIGVDEDCIIGKSDILNGECEILGKVH